MGGQSGQCGERGEDSEVCEDGECGEGGAVGEAGGDSRGSAGGKRGEGSAVSEDSAGLSGRGEGRYMELQLDLNKEYGIVLEGGGAKGAYQVGAWKAIKEAGICIRGVAGTSVGALNGALVCMDDFAKAERIWENISYSRVMDVDDTLMDKIKNFQLKNLPDFLAGGTKLLKERGFDVAPLKGLIDDLVDEERIRSSDRELYVVTYSLSDRQPLVVNVKEVPDGEIGDMLMASAYLIGFKQERLGGKFYMDGGGVNNVPVDVLMDRGYKDIIVVRIYGLGVDTERHLKVPEDVNLYHIYPRQDLGGILEFDRRRAKRNMVLGYFDAKRMLYGLGGKGYYIDAPSGEAYYFDKMMSELPRFLVYLRPEMEDELGKIPAGYRFFTEKLFPEMAREMKLREGWDYRDLYLGLLEELAKQYRISRFKVYTVDELVGR